MKGPCGHELVPAVRLTDNDVLQSRLEGYRRVDPHRPDEPERILLEMRDLKGIIRVYLDADQAVLLGSFLHDEAAKLPATTKVTA